MNYLLKLYIYGPSINSAHAVHNLKKLMAALDNDLVQYTIVDIKEHPKAAIDNQVLATPLLVKESPPPKIKIIGDLSLQKQLIVSLGLEELMKKHSATVHGEVTDESSR